MRSRLVTVLALVAVGAGAFSVADAQPDTLRTRWVRAGFAEASDLTAADFDLNGDDEIVLGGRGIALLDEGSLTSHVPRWSVAWNHEEGNVLDGGDNTWVTGMRTAEMTGDGVPDLFVTSSDTDAYLIDGAAGDKLWWNGRTGGALSFGFTLIDADDDPAPDMFPTGGTTAISGRTGEPLWEAPLPKGVRWAVSAELDGEPGRDVILSITPPGASTDPLKNVDPLTANTVFAFTGTGELLYQHRAISTVTGVGAADLDGDGIDEVIAGTFNGVVYALGLDGMRWTAATGLGRIDAVAAADVNGDGTDEVMLGTGNGLNTLVGDVYDVMALSSHGAQLWRTIIDQPVSTMEVAQLDGDEPPELLVGAGTTFAFGNSGLALALDTDPLAVQRELWSIDTHKETKSFTVATIAGRRVVVVGGSDPLLRAVEPATGESVWTYTTGGYTRPVTSADLDGDGGTEVIHGDDQGYVVVSEEDGTEAWSTRLDIGSDGHADAVAADDLDGDGSTEVIAAGSRFFQPGDGGTLELFNAAGTRRWKLGLPGGAGAIRTADLDGDGTKEIVIAKGGPCGVAAFDHQGNELWTTDINPCVTATIAVGQGDTDPLPEIAYGDMTLFNLPHMAVVDGDGSIIWDEEVNAGTAWLRGDEDTFLFGGFIQGSKGHVTRRSGADGAVVWQTIFPEPPERDTGSASRYGIVGDDFDGDGSREVFASSDASDVLMLDGGSGEIRWRTPLEDQTLIVTQAHQSGPLAYVQPTGGDPVVVAAQWSIHRKRSKTFALSTGGVVLDEHPMGGESRSMAAVRFPDGGVGAAVGAGLGVYAFEVQAGAEPSPSPTSTETAEPTPTESGSPTVTESPTSSPSESPLPQMTSVSFTENSQATGQYSDETYFEARVTDSDGDPISGAEVTFKFIESSRSFSAITDENGVASVSPTLTEQPGPYNLTARYAGDDDHAGSSTTTTFVIAKEDTDLQLTVEGKGNNRSLTARLADRDAPNDGIATRTVDFIADGEPIGSATTDDNGVATLKPPPRYRGGRHDYEARFEGDDYYRASSDTRTSD